jgi:hypothetical protein
MDGFGTLGHRIVQQIEPPTMLLFESSAFARESITALNQPAKIPFRGGTERIKQRQLRRTIRLSDGSRAWRAIRQ